MLDRLGRFWIPVRRTWRLNERQYGVLTGRSKRRTRIEAGPELYEQWRRSLHGCPSPLPEDRLALLRADPRYASLPGEGVPAAETFAVVIARVLPYWIDLLAPPSLAVPPCCSPHTATFLRALVALLSHLDEPGIHDLNIPPGRTPHPHRPLRSAAAPRRRQTPRPAGHVLPHGRSRPRATTDNTDGKDAPTMLRISRLHAVEILDSRARWPSGAGPGGFRRLGRAGGCWADVPEVAADTGGG